MTIHELIVILSITPSQSTYGLSVGISVFVTKTIEIKGILIFNFTNHTPYIVQSITIIRKLPLSSFKGHSHLLKAKDLQFLIDLRHHQ